MSSRIPRHDQYRECHVGCFFEVLFCVMGTWFLVLIAYFSDESYADMSHILHTCARSAAFARRARPANDIAATPTRNQNQTKQSQQKTKRTKPKPNNYNTNTTTNTNNTTTTNNNNTTTNNNINNNNKNNPKTKTKT